MKALEADDPREVGRYRVVGQLGSGGMGRVLLGLSRDGRLVAVKLVHSSLASDPDFRSRFSREVGASRAVSGAYTAAVMDADPDAKVPWLASVFVPGPPLDTAVEQAGPLPVNSVRVLAAGLAAALGEIHRAGLVHRDLKPSNVLLTEDGPRVIDFGIARNAEAHTRLTQAGSVVGSPGYMSPEQVEGRPLTPATDVFSLGAVLTLAATGHKPFGEGSTPQLLYKVVFEEPDLSKVPADLRDMIAGCLVKNPDERLSPDELMDAVGQIDPGGSWLPAPVHHLIGQQKAQLRQILSDSEVQGSNAAATALRTTGTPAQAPVSPPTRGPAASPHTPPPGPPTAGPRTPASGVPQHGHAPPAGPRPGHGAPQGPQQRPLGPPTGPQPGGFGASPYGGRPNRVPMFVAASVIGLVLVLAVVVGIVVAATGGDDPPPTAGPTPTPTTTQPQQTTTTPAVPTSPNGSATLANPQITTAKSVPTTGNEFCNHVRGEDIRRAFGVGEANRIPLPLCTVNFQGGGHVFVSQLGVDEGQAFEVRGNSALLIQTEPSRCQVTVALNGSAGQPFGAVLDIDARDVRNPARPLCEAVVELAGTVFDRLPDA